jgi:hypothetical protein
LVAVPSFFLLEIVGPVIELVGYPAVIAGSALGYLSLTFLLAFAVLSVFVGAVLSVSALALEEFNFRRYQRGREAARLLVMALAENVGYRQLLTAWRVLGLVDVARRRRGWGEMHRRGLGYAPARGESRGR